MDARSPHQPFAVYRNFRDLFDEPIGSDDSAIHRFTIPDYQRSYDWGASQRSDLFSDLMRLEQLVKQSGKEREHRHFCGTVICTPVPHKTDRLHIVDGQQRLSTLVLLHSRLSRRVSREPFIVAGSGARFKPEGTDGDYFLECAKGHLPGEPQTPGQLRYQKATKEIDQWLDDGAIDESFASGMLTLIENHLEFILFLLPSDGEVSKVFETINNRGKPLTQMDLVKNHLMYMKDVHNWDTEVKSAWSSIQRNVQNTVYRKGYEGIDTVLHAVVNATIKPGRRSAGESDYVLVKEHICKEEHGERFSQFLRLLKSGFEAFRELRAADRIGRNDLIGTQLTYLNYQPNIAGVLPLILLRQRHRNGNEKAEVLEAIEKANFRLYGFMNSAKRSNSHHAVLYKLAYEYNRLKSMVTENTEGTPSSTSSDEVDADWLISKLTQIVVDRQRNGVRHIVKALTLDDDDTTDFYHWPALRYFLARWEQSLMKGQSLDFGALGRGYKDSHQDDYLAREHIYPASSKDCIAEYRDKLQLRRLGNFMLLAQGVNNRLNNEIPSNKVAKMAELCDSKQLLIQNKKLGEYTAMASRFREHLEERQNQVFGLTNRSRFNKGKKKPNADLVEAKTLCDMREEHMISFALSAWQMPGESFADADKFCGLFSFSFCGETYMNSEEHSAIKDNMNYLLQDPLDGEVENVQQSRRLKRLRERDTVLERSSIFHGSESVRKAA